MRKIDHIRKVVYIIVGILTIISLVFTLYKKIGHASDSSTDSFLPIECDSKNFKSDNGKSYSDFITDLNSIVSNSNTGFPGFNTIPSNLIFRCHDDNGVIYYTAIYSLGYLYFRNPNNNYSNLNFTNAVLQLSSGYSVNIFNNNYYSRTSVTTFRYVDGVLTRQSSNTQSGGINLTLSQMQNELFFCSSDEILYYNTQNVFFVSDDISNNVPIINGHSKGGVLANYQSSFDLLEDSSDVPKVDTSVPSDSSSVPAWLGKILNGLGVIGNSIQSGVLTIGDYIGTLGESIGEFFNSVGEKIDAIKDSIDSFFAWVTEPPNNETILSNIQPYLESNSMIQGFLSSKNAIQGVYSDITGVTAKTSSQMKWTIPFNLPGLSNNFTATIDFGWYENIRSIVQPVLIMIISVSFILSLIRSIPGILHGNSPEGDS